MSWFGKPPFRNTTGQALSGNLLYSGQHNTSKPRPGRFNAHSQSASELLRARVERGDYRLNIATARAYVTQCQAKADRQQALPAAQVPGRSKSFLGAAVRNVGACLGMGMGHVRKAKPAWSRPDRSDLPTPSGTANVGAANTRTSLRAAAQHANRLAGTRQQVSGVIDLLRHELTATDETLATAQAGNTGEVAVRMLDDARQCKGSLERKVNRLEALQHNLDLAHEQAAAEQLRQQQAFTASEAARTEQLLSQPPGFAPGPECAALSASLRTLTTQLESQAPSDGQWPTHDTLEVVCSALAGVSKGNPALAADTLDRLMQAPLTALVPQPGRWFDGSRSSLSTPRPVPSPLENLAGTLLDLPCGAELLTRLVAPGAGPATTTQRDAVAVYHQAMRTVRQTSDSASANWLDRAALAACHIVHPASPPVVLSVRHRAAFHGVRNGLNSVAQRSTWDEANRQLQRFADTWVNDLKGRNPLRTRGQAGAAATQVGLPTPVKQANDEMLQTCAGLRHTITAHLIEARREAQRRGQAIDLGEQEPLLQAATLLRYIEKHADQHLRLDQMPIARRAWRSVDRHTAQWIQTEGRTQSAPAQIQAEVARLGLQPPNSSVYVPPARDEALDDLQTSLWDLRLEQVTALKALDVIRQKIGPLVTPPTPGHSAALGNELFVIPEEGEDERSTQATHKLTRAKEAIDKTRSLQPSVDAFMGKKAQWRSGELSNWVTPVVGENSSAISMSQGRTLGVNTSGLSTTLTHITGVVGVVARLDADLSRTDQSVFRYAKQSRGLEAFMGDTKQRQGRFGVAGGVGLSLFSLPTEDGASASVVGNWSISRSKTDTQGVLLRSPVYGARALPQAKEDFSAMMDTVLNWKSLRDPATAEAYSSPLEALLARHPNASVSTIEQLRTVATTTRSGIAASVGGGGPFARKALPNFFGSVSFGVGLGSERLSENTSYKTRAGSQAFAGSTANTTATVATQFSYSGQLGGVVMNSGDSNLAVRGRSSSLMLQLDLYRRQAASSSTVIRQPDGTLVGEKAREFNTFEPFKKAVEERWDDWIERGVSKGRWSAQVPVAVRKLLVEQDLDSFMQAAAQSVREGGTVSLNETLEIRPEVCAELSACLALEELAQSQGRPEQARSAFDRRQALLQTDTSYQPYKLKAIVRSQSEKGKGINLILSALQKGTASASHEYDTFPKS